MKNIQVIDGAENCVYDIFSANDEDFSLIFPGSQNVAFIEEVHVRAAGRSLDAAFARIWNCPVRKSEVRGIHGILFFGLEKKKAYYPTRRDEEAINPDGSLIRRSQA